MPVAMYLRKSRAEELNESIEETLRKHKEALSDFARENNLTIVHIYEEVVSGESLYARPQMLQLLADTSENRYDAILCMDIDRLGRGAMSDQGIILETLKQSNTKIITPRKIYDLNNELDEEYTEFETFMARRELKIIKRRMQRGVLKSIEDGAYLANAPYGYKNAIKNKRPTLTINEEEACFVRMIFDMYVHENKGCQVIADTLNAMGAKPHRSNSFCRNSVRSILKNPTFTGKTVWNQKTRIRNGTKSKAKTIYHPREQWTVVKGLHPAIIDEELFSQAQKILSGRYHPPYYQGSIENPLAGIVRCCICGNFLQRRPSHQQKGADTLICTTKGCVKSCRLDLVEDAFIHSIKEQLSFIKLEQHIETDDFLQKDLQKKHKIMENEKSTILIQKNRLQDLLEQGIYDTDTYLDRNAVLNDKLNRINQAFEIFKQKYDSLSGDVQKNTTKKIESVLEAYTYANAQEKNMILKSLIAEACYYKAKDWKPAQFELFIKLRSLD